MHLFNDYSISGYGNMVIDQRRMGAFVGALRKAIQPGDVVLDIGTGAGIFAFLACQFGASRVYAVEPDPAIELAKRSAAATPYADRITWIQGLTTELDLPERADVAVGDLHGTLPFFKGNIESMYDARQRHLKPGGRLLPVRDTLRVRPAESPHEYSQVENPWRQNAFGLDLSEGAALVVNRWWRADRTPIDEGSYLAPARDWGQIVYGETEHSQLANQLDWTVSRAGTMHGYYVWFDADLGDGFGYSNAPHLGEMVYGRAFFPLEQPVAVDIGDVLKLDISVRMLGGEHLYRWRTDVIAQDGTRKASFDQSTFKSRIPDVGNMLKMRKDAVPTLSEDGRIARQVLAAIDAGTTLEAIADTIRAGYPNKFRAPEEALNLVSKLALKYC